MTLDNLIGKNLEKIIANHDTIRRLSITLGIDSRTVILLDAMRKQRNVADYSGDVVPESVVKDCITQAEKLLKHFNILANFEDTEQ